jgi:TolB-like protein
MSVVLLLGLLLFGLQVLRSPAPDPAAANLPQEPTVYLSALTSLSDLPALTAYTSALNDQLSSVLAQFEDVQVGFFEAGEVVTKSEGSFLLSGTVASSASGIEVTVVLTDAVNGAAVWNLRFNQPMPGLNTEAVATLAARRIMRELGPFRGPVHAHGRHWLDENVQQLPAVNAYVCLLTYRYAREFVNPAAIAKAIDCHDRLLKQQPDLPLALAADAWLHGRVVTNNASPDDLLATALAQQADQAERARQLAPESSFAYEQVGAIQDWQENYATAQRSFAIALGFEPLNTDARANYAITLARSGDWSGAMRQAQFAISDTPYPSPWYYALPSLIAFRDGRLERSIEDARIAAQGSEIGAIVALAAAGLADDRQAITDFQARVMGTESLRRYGILPWLGVRIRDDGLLAKVAEGLRAGGIPESALTAQF